MFDERIIFVFIDGIGLAEPGPKNPFSLAAMPNLQTRLGGRLLKGKAVDAPGILFKGIDANLGVDGIPQSATGQTSLFTGRNASRILGYHLPAFPTRPLIEVIDEASIFKQVIERGGAATFANAYTMDYFQRVEVGDRTHSATTLCMLAAKLPFRFIPELNRGEAVYWDITNRSLVDNGVPDVSLTTPEAAGRNLARLGREHHFTLFECFLSDIIGHKRDLNRAVDFLEMLDRFLGAVLDEAGQDVHVLISSDHGNLEDLETGGHTRNDVPLIVFGPRAGQMAGVRSIVNIPETLLSRFWA